MSHCFGSRCRTHERIMVDNTCPERGCPGNHGWVDADCDDRCPDYALERFKVLLEAAWPQEERDGLPEECKVTPAHHAWLDQFLAENREPPTAT